MAENGSGRMDRIEAALERITQRHEQLTTTTYLHEQWLLRMEDYFERLAAEQAAGQRKLDQLSIQSDKRITDLVLAISELIKQHRNTTP
jgi:hypothetical protein